MEFQFEFLFQPGLKFAFELECEFDLDFEFKSEFVVEVALELELELASSSIHLPVFLPNVKKSTATREKQSLNSTFISILFESYLSGTQNWFQNDPLGGPNGTPLGISDLEAPSNLSRCTVPLGIARKRQPFVPRFTCSILPHTPSLNRLRLAYAPTSARSSLRIELP